MEKYFKTEHLSLRLYRHEGGYFAAPDKKILSELLSMRLSKNVTPDDIELVDYNLSFLYGYAKDYNEVLEHGKKMDALLPIEFDSQFVD